MENPKSQIPKPNETPNPKSQQIDVRKLSELGVGSSLGFWIWDFLPSTGRAGSG